VISNAFTLDDGDLSNILSFLFRYSVISGGSNFNWSGTLGSQSLGVYLYDVTNSVWLQPSAGMLGMTSIAQQQVGGYFQSSPTVGQQYRIAILALQASTTAAATLNFDDFYIGPQSNLTGAAMTDWRAFTPTGTWTTGTWTGFWKQLGDSMQVHALITLSGAPTGNFSINLPSGYSIDTTKMPSTGLGAVIPGSWVKSNHSAQPYDAVLRYNSTTNLTAVIPGGTNWSETALVSATVPATFASGDTVEVYFEVPIAGWSSNTQMSASLPSGQVVAKAYLSGNTAVSAGAAIGFNRVAIDTTGNFDTTNHWFLVKTTGAYNISGTFQTTATATNVQVFKNGSAVNDGPASNYLAAAGTGVTNGSLDFQFKAGDKITLNSDTAATFSAATLFSISMLPNTSTVLASPSVNARYTDTSGQTVGTSYTQLSFATKSFDSSSIWNTNVATIPVSGKYRIKASIELSSTSLSTSQSLALVCYHNGSQYSVLDVVLGNGTANFWYVQGDDVISCVAGDTVSIYALSGVSAALTASSTTNYVSIERIG
jgi:hypothetical protein